ncbi:MAG: hypothetical protein RRB13_11610 [bacterium]|nr:hypothetical protein [bacterium]
MPLVIDLTGQSVHIAKYQLEFPFSAPAGALTEAALETYALLRGSDKLQTESSRDQRGEVMRLLQSYGLALFEAIFPEAIRQKLPKEGVVYIRAKDEAVRQLPFELLYDGSSFIAQTHGLVRLYGARSLEPNHPFERRRPQLSAALMGHDPLSDLPRSSSFLVPIEEFALLVRGSNKRLELRLDGDTNWARLLSSLESGPDLFLFSGYQDKRGWRLAGEPFAEADLRLAKAAEEAVRKGMRLMILATDQMLTQVVGLEAYGAMGVPAVITLGGRLSRGRMMDYFNSLLSGLARGETLLKSHRQAVNQLQAALPLSWDWSWIRLSVAKELVNHARLDPLRAFPIDADARVELPYPAADPLILNRRRFTGNKEVLAQLISALVTGPEQGVIWLRSLMGQHQEEYVLELLRRLAPRCDFSLNLLYYYRWGYHENQPRSLPDSELAQEFEFLFSEEKIGQYFDQSQIPLRQGTDPEQRYLLIFYPPDKVDPVFEGWLLAQREAGWRILLLSQQSFVTELSTQVISSDRTSCEELLMAFEDRLPEVWGPLLQGQVPAQMRNHALLSLAAAAQDPAVQGLFCENREVSELWPIVFGAVYNRLSHLGKRLLSCLYLLRVKVPRENLAVLLGPEEIDRELEHLFEGHLIERNLEGSLYWIAGNLYGQIRRHDLLPAEGLIKNGQELMNKINGKYDQMGGPRSLLVAGSQYLLSELARLGAVETALGRSLQFAKRISAQLDESPRMIGQLLLTAVELALVSKQPEALEKTFVNILAVLDNLPFETQTIQLYEWLLQAEEQRHNWPQVAELQVRLAGLYARASQRERAKGLLVSATQLGLDLPNPAEKFGVLVEIAMLLLELGELDKLNDLLETANFDPSHLNQENLARLWLIDGHIQFDHKQKGPALFALEKALSYKHPFISDGLSAQTRLILAQLHSAPEQITEDLIQAAQLFEKAREIDRAAQVYEELCTHYKDQGEPEKATAYLEWLYGHSTQAGLKDRAQGIAHQLGGLYFRIGDQAKSTDFYKKAQEAGPQEPTKLT